jgi:hypothetical protein
MTMNRQVENLEKRSLMNSAPVLSDVALVVSGLDTDNRIESIGKSGCQWVDQQVLADNRGPAHFSFDAAAANACFAGHESLDLFAGMEEMLAHQIGQQTPPAKGNDGAFQVSDIDWLADRFDEALGSDSASDR